MSNTLIVPANHLPLLTNILDKLGATNFKENNSKYSPDFVFELGGHNFWGYKEGIVVEFNGDSDLTLKLINEQYEYFVKQLSKEQEKQD